MPPDQGLDSLVMVDLRKTDSTRSTPSPWLVGFLGPRGRPVEQVALARHPGLGGRTPRADRAPPGGQCHWLAGQLAGAVGS